MDTYIGIVYDDDVGDYPVGNSTISAVYYINRDDKNEAEREIGNYIRQTFPELLGRLTVIKMNLHTSLVKEVL